MSQSTHFDAIVIGAGQAGVPLSKALATAGHRTALVEQAHVGGTCINEGCTPTKTMVASARVAYLARRAADFGVVAGPVTVDMMRIRERKRAIVASFRGGSEARIGRTPGLELVNGEASFTGPQDIAVAMHDGSVKHLTSDLIFLNTGARPAAPRVPGLSGPRVLDSTSIMELDVLPEHLIVLGGGYIGLEFGQMFSRFGSQVSILQRGDQLLGLEDPDVAEAVRQILVEDGIAVHLNTTAIDATIDSGGGLTVQTRGPSGNATVSGSHVLVAAGRTPNTDRLNLAAAGITPDARGFIPVNAHLETSVPGIYALGDVNGGPAFTHTSYDDFRVIRANLLSGDAALAARGETASPTRRLLPYTVYIDPQLGRVGLTEAQAKATGRPIRTMTMPMSHVARALELDETRGFMKAIVDAETHHILGAAILGIEGGEIASLIQVAMLGNVPCTALRDAVFAHPTLAEALNNLFAAVE